MPLRQIVTRVAMYVSCKCIIGAIRTGGYNGVLSLAGVREKKRLVERYRRHLTL